MFINKTKRQIHSANTAAQLVLHSTKDDGCGNSNCVAFRHLRLGDAEANAGDRLCDTCAKDRSRER
jgi:hypothetical protein